MIYKKFNFVYPFKRLIHFGRLYALVRVMFQLRFVLVSSDKVIQQHQLPTNHQQQHRHSHHHPLGPPPPRSHPPLLNIPQSKPHGGNHGPVIGSNFILTSPAVYSPHLYALQGQLHFSHPPTHPHPPCSSSSSSSSASPASVHLRPNVLPPPPAMHYSLHHPFHISSRHSEFSGW